MRARAGDDLGAPKQGSLGDRWTDPNDPEGRWAVEWVIMVCRDAGNPGQFGVGGCGRQRGGWYPAHALERGRVQRDDEGRVHSPCSICLGKLDRKLAQRARRKM